MFTVKTIGDEFIIAKTKSCIGAIRTGRKHQREIHQFGGCAEGFNVYDENGKPARYQRCNNVGEKWIDVTNKNQGWI